MLKISEFSRLSQVTVKTLRYYADIGLLPPAHTDPWTKYRYYQLDQLSRLRRILMLKGMGFALVDIGRILDQDLTPQQIWQMAQLKRADLLARLEQQQQQLEQLDYWLEQLEQEQQMSDYTVMVKTIEPVVATYVRETVPTVEELTPYLSKMFGKAETLADQHGERDGYCIAEYYDMEWTGKDIDVAAAITLKQANSAADGSAIHKLNGGLVAFTTHVGPYRFLPKAYDAVLKWIGAHGYRVSGASREFYHPSEEHREDQSNCVTEVQFFVEKVS